MGLAQINAAGRRLQPGAVVPKLNRRWLYSALPYYAAAALMPGIRLLDLFNRNWAEYHLVFSHALILTGALAVAGLSLFLVLRSFTGSEEGGLLISALCWLCFWLSEDLFVMTLIFNRFRSFAAFMGAGLILAAAALRWRKPRFAKIRPAFNALAISLVALFVFNLIPAIHHASVLFRARGAMVGTEHSERPFYIKRDFQVNPALPSPDIYWFHLDGMMSLETVERFWGEPREHLRGEFARRGFLIYENALLNAGFTDAALPALFSPAFYDSFLGALLAENETELRASRTRQVIRALSSAGLIFARDIVARYELFNALIARGYEFELPDFGANLPVFVYSLSPSQRFLTGDWLTLLPAAAYFHNLFGGNNYVEVEVRQFDCGFYPIARFVFKSFAYTHMTQVWSLDPNLARMDLTAVHLYPAAFERIAHRALYYIDAILEQNPNAVIVLQSDHGFHYYQTQRHLIDQGYSLSQVLELMHSVFSAVRIPPQYGGLDAPIAPLNISRELVNRFVGENYVLLPGAGERVLGGYGVDPN